MKKSKLDDDKLLLGSARIRSLITDLQTASGDISRPIKRFVECIDRAPSSLVQDFLDVPELQTVWLALLEKHSELWTQWKQKPLPHFSIFNQLVGYYRYCLAETDDSLGPEERLQELHKAMEQGSIQAMLLVGDSYIEKIQTNEIKALNADMIAQVNVFATLFLTPGHIIAADIYLAIWAKAVGIHANFRQAIHHLALAELSLRDSGPHISNAYSTEDFMSASEGGKVFRSVEYKGHSVAKNIEANLKIFKTYTGLTFELKPAIESASIEMNKKKISEDKPITVKASDKKLIKNLRLFFQSKLKAQTDSTVLGYVLENKF
jgi:Family of unknown function (DUF5630)